VLGIWLIDKRTGRKQLVGIRYLAKAVEILKFSHNFTTFVASYSENTGQFLKLIMRVILDGGWMPQH